MSEGQTGSPNSTSTSSEAEDIIIEVTPAVEKSKKITFEAQAPPITDTRAEAMGKVIAKPLFEQRHLADEIIEAVEETIADEAATTEIVEVNANANQPNAVTVKVEQADSAANVQTSPQIQQARPKPTNDHNLSSEPSTTSAEQEPTQETPQQQQQARHQKPSIEGNRKPEEDSGTDDLQHTATNQVESEPSDDLEAEPRQEEATQNTDDENKPKAVVVPEHLLERSRAAREKLKRDEEARQRADDEATEKAKTEGTKIPDHLLERARLAHERAKQKVVDINESDAAATTEPKISEPELLDYKASLSNIGLKEFGKKSPEERNAAAAKWVKKVHEVEVAANDGEIVVGQKDYREFMDTLNDAQKFGFREREAKHREYLVGLWKSGNTVNIPEHDFTQYEGQEVELKSTPELDPDEEVDEDAPTNESSERLADKKRLKEIEEQNKLLQKELEKIHKMLGKKPEAAQPRPIEASNYEPIIVAEFLNALPQPYYEAWKSKPKDERDQILKEWLENGKAGLQALTNEFNFFASLEITPEEWANLSEEKRKELFDQFRNSDNFSLSDFVAFGRRDIDQIGSLHQYEMETETITEINPDTGVEETKEINHIYNVVDKKRKIHKKENLTHEQKELLKAKREEDLTLKYRINSKLAAWLYIALNRVFNIEAFIAEENKKNQELIRATVDTGPDNNERWAFAVEGPDGKWRQIETGAEVSETVAKHWRKRALQNPSRFQAFCHYELSKQPEHKQMETWEVIFSMMAEEGYDKYAMLGVAVGLQFMNKPQYLAVKNTKLVYSPVFEEYEDSHGHKKPVLDPLTNEKVPKRYTAENAYETNIFGKKVLKRDPDGKRVNIGDIIRNPYKVQFDTIEMEINKWDQEYNETKPNGDPMYELRKRMRYDYVQQPDGSMKPVAVETGEVYKVKRILNVKTTGYAHEIGGKFMSYQYGFRGSDVSIALDFTRNAFYTCERLAKMYDINRPETMSKEDFISWQENLMALNRIYLAVSASRMGGSPGAEGKGPGADAETQMQMQRNMDANQGQGGRGMGTYPPRISGTAEAIALWETLARYIDAATNMFPGISQIRQSDFQAPQDPYYTRNDEYDLAA